MIKLANDWQDYKLLDIGNGEKIEKWNNVTLVRPDPQVIWPDKTNYKIWDKYDAKYERSSSGGGQWIYKGNLPRSWQVKYKELVFNIKPMGFKHTGLFPEQAVNWDYVIDSIKKEKIQRKEDKINENIKVLNLFAYTGGATVACSYAGAEVCHVDSSKGMTDWAKENVKASGLENNKVRYIVDDVIKFVQREIRRGNKYDGIIMDPPVYGRGTNGEIWDIEKDLYNLVSLCSQLLSDNPIFFIINSYTCSLSNTLLKTLLDIVVYPNIKHGKTESFEIGLPVDNSKIVLPCGVTTRWSKY